MNALNWLANLIPEQYRVAIAIKKVSYTVGKLAAGFLTAQLIAKGKLTPEQCGQIELATTAIVAGGLEAVHDWAKVKWPDQKWL